MCACVCFISFVKESLVNVNNTWHSRLSSVGMGDALQEPKWFPDKE